MNIGEAIKSLRPQAEFSVLDDDINQITWIKCPDIPTDAEILAERDRLLAEFRSREYQRQRAANYPSIGDQLDALFHAGVFPPEMAAQIQAIKDQFPKG